MKIENPSLESLTAEIKRLNEALEIAEKAFERILYPLPPPLDLDDACHEIKLNNKYASEALEAIRKGKG